MWHVVATLRIADMILLAIAGLLTAWACGELQGPRLPYQAVGAIVAAVVAAFVLDAAGTYGEASLAGYSHRLRAVCMSAAAGGAAAACFALLMDWPTPGRVLWPVCWTLAAGGLVALAARVSTIRVRELKRANRLSRRVAVVGDGSYSQRFIGRMTEDPARSAYFVGLYQEAAADPGWDGETASSERAGAPWPVLGPLSDIVARSRRERIDAIVLALSEADVAGVTRMRDALRSVTADIYLATEVLELTHPSGLLERWGDNTLLKLASRPLSYWQAAQKLAFDMALCGAVLLPLLPVFGLIALLIKLDSPGPVFFRQERRGYNNGTFRVFKFRTMYHHMADRDAERQTTRGDPRITRVGRILRRTSLDELPQILNILRGEMSLVGPRPHALKTKAGNLLFSDAVPDYALRYRVKPGLTGWAQVNGLRGETTTRKQIEDRVAHDLYYIENWSIALDIKIIFLTVLREFNSKVAF